MSKVCGGDMDASRRQPDETKQLLRQHRHFAALPGWPAGLAGFAFYVSRAGAFGEFAADTFRKSRAPRQAKTYGEKPARVSRDRKRCHKQHRRSEDGAFVRSRHS
jgi:hypothetical protein